jgi:hypothetical protein
MRARDSSPVAVEQTIIDQEPTRFSDRWNNGLFARFEADS